MATQGFVAAARADTHSTAAAVRPATPDAPEEFVVVASCQGLHAIDARHAMEFYRPYGVASAAGAVLFALLVWLLEG